MKAQEKYKPIDCSLHEILLDRATRKKEIEVNYISEQGMKIQVKGLIVDVFTRNHEEFVKLNSGELIRLDHLALVDGIDFSSGLSCDINPKPDQDSK